MHKFTWVRTRPTCDPSFGLSGFMLFGQKDRAAAETAVREMWESSIDKSNEPQFDLRDALSEMVEYAG